ncbi:MAG: 2,3-diphosphoglycerate-dependent phosphoglycerate mutase, partial [Lutibacter sp.]
DEILKVNIPTGIPLVYELNENFKVKAKYYLGNDDEINKAMNSVVNQGKSSK